MKKLRCYEIIICKIIANNESEAFPQINNGSLFTKNNLGKIHCAYVFPQLLITEVDTDTVSLLLIFQTGKKEHNEIQHCQGAWLKINTKYKLPCHITNCKKRTWIESPKINLISILLIFKNVQYPSYWAKNYIKEVKWKLYACHVCLLVSRLSTSTSHTNISCYFFVCMWVVFLFHFYFLTILAIFV